MMTGCAQAPAPVVAPPVFPAKITQFYASPPQVPKGGRTLLCYGVESAASVTLDPGNEALSPALTKCIEKVPAANTTYTLTVKGKDGKTLVQSVSVSTGFQALKFVDLVINAPQVKPGEAVNFCFQAQGAVDVGGGPGTFQKGGAANGDCLMDHPRQTTTYQITIRGAGNQIETEKMTVKVAP